MWKMELAKMELATRGTPFVDNAWQAALTPRILSQVRPVARESARQAGVVDDHRRPGPAYATRTLLRKAVVDKPNRILHV